MTIKKVTMLGTLNIGPSGSYQNWSSQVRSCQVETETNTGEKIHVLSGEQIVGGTSYDSKLTGTLLQDFGQPNSIVEYSYTAAGTTVNFEFVPSTSNGKKITGQLVMQPVAQIGGDVEDNNTPVETDFEFTILGTPTFAPIA
ncbi:hypothetical protein [Psychromicrobium sp. YIM B11713]|uniref:hypothetical protein n=1 Tax=Psychromicrobium sp. YIM B11713 TaxID=3145233 RepID=UPI00374E6B70